MEDLLAALEASALGRLVRGSGAWTYALINLAHILGIATLFGAVLILDLRLLARRAAALAPIADIAVPVARTGFVLAVVSGVGLLAANATDYIGNPFLLIKFPAIAVAAVNAWIVGRTSAWRAAREGHADARDRARLALMAGVSLASWLTAVAAGRMIGYW